MTRVPVLPSDAKDVNSNDTPTITRTITARDGEQFSTRLEKHGKQWVVLLEGDTFTARVPLSSFIASLLAKKAHKGCVA